MLSIGTYPVINGGVNPSGFAEVYNEEENTITISQGGASAGYVNWMNCKFFAGAHCYVVRPINDEINNRYLYHFFKSNESNLMKSQHGAGIPALKRDNVKKIVIPIPPLEVQAEVVRILDKFTSLLAELKAELKARKLQYEYYRDQLLSFGTDDPTVQWLPLGEVLVSIRTGLNPRKFFSLNTEDATNYYVTIREIKGGVLKITEKTDKINDEALQLCNKRSNLEIGDLLFSGTGTIGEIFVIDSHPNNWNIKEGVYSLKPIKELVSSNYLKHLLLSSQIKYTFLSKAEGGTVKSISMKILSETIIPIPPIAEQERIVGILDKFDNLTNSLTEGIPKEIEMRQLQYEYYRDALLSF